MVDDFRQEDYFDDEDFDEEEFEEQEQDLESRESSFFDDIRDEASDSPYFEDLEDEGQDTYDYADFEDQPPSRSMDRLFGMTPAQRLIIAAMLFGMVCILSTFCLLIFEKIALPI